MKKIMMLITVMVMAIGAYAQIEAPVKWSYAAKRVSATEAVVFVKATIQDGWHIYSLNVKDGGPIKTSFTFPKTPDYSAVGQAVEPKPLSKYEKAFGMDVTYFEKSVIFKQTIKLKSAKATVVKGKLEYETCNDRKCLPPEDLDFSVAIAAK